MFFSSVLLKRMEDTYLKQSEIEKKKQANTIATVVREEKYLEGNINKALFESLIQKKAEDNNCRVLVVDSSGFVVMDSSGLAVKNTLMNSAVISALGNKEATLKNEKLQILMAAVPVFYKQSEQVVGAVVVVASIDEVYKPVTSLRRQVNLIALLLAILASLLSFVISSYFTRPLKTLLNFVQKVTNGQLDQEVQLDGQDEIAELGNAFNHMTKQLQLVEQSRQEFVSNVSHELKTPLSSIKVLTDSLMLEENVPVETYKEFFGDINSEVDRLNNIITDLLNLVRLDQRENPLNIAPVDLKDMMDNLLKRLAPLANKKAIKLVFESPKTSIEAEIDKVKLSLAITNLVENAIKYTPEGGKVKVVLDSDVQDAVIIVADTGIGIAKEEQSRIFERFYRTDKTRNRETGGTGLGLAITYKTILMHNGSINVDSEEGCGSTFTVQIPLKHILEGEVQYE